MSLLYKALNQASQLREKASPRPDAAAAPRLGAPLAAPLADRLMGDSFETAAKKGGAKRIARFILFGLLGAGIIAVSLSFLLTPPQIAAPETPDAPAPSAVAEVAPPPHPVPAETSPEAAPPAPQVAAQDIAPAPDAEAETAMDARPTPEASAAAPERIGATPGPAEIMPEQKRIQDGGLENFVEEQLAREAQSGLRAPVNIGRTGGDGAFSRAPVEITDDTAIVRERYESAAAMLERGRPEDSLQIYDQLLRNNPKDRLALLGRAAALQKLGRTLMAVSAYEDMLAAYPGDEWAMVNLLGLVSAQEPQHALTQLEKLRRLNPRSALLPAQIGMLQMAQGNYEMAARSLEAALALDPENAKYIFNLAVVYDKWGQTQTALRYYRQCLEIAAQNPDGQVPLEAVRQRMAFLDVR